jgi:NitT/TauT family transport system substrate-binding protein
MAIGDNIVTPAVRANGYGGIDASCSSAAIDQIAVGYQFKAKDKAVESFDPSFLPAAAQRSASSTASR